MEPVPFRFSWKCCVSKTLTAAHQSFFAVWHLRAQVPQCLVPFFECFCTNSRETRSVGSVGGGRMWIFSSHLQICWRWNSQLWKEIKQEHLCMWISSLMSLKPLSLCTNKVLTHLRDIESVFVYTHAYSNTQRFWEGLLFLSILKEPWYLWWLGRN